MLVTLTGCTQPGVKVVNDSYCYLYHPQLCLSGELECDLNERTYNCRCSEKPLKEYMCE